MILDGKIISEKIKKDLSIKINEMDVNICLTVLLVGNSKESLSYINMKRRMCESLGIRFILKHFDENVEECIVLKEIQTLNEDKDVDGILIQLPLPDSFNKDKLIDQISYEKDVDGFHTMNAGKIFQNRDINIIPCTPQGCIDMIDYYEIDVEGLNITIIGTSNLVGLPLSMLLLQRGATISLCNINTKDIKLHTIDADMIITCCGVANMVKSDWIKEDVIIIDIGINHIKDKSGKHKLVGDVDFDDVYEKCSYITPVPGGVGPMTVISLMKNLVKLTKNNLNI
jgi:methylenetetrahydrofolate dehydrogenase (NADP+) / methenyltetrahydrofolate cyclohydrolase